MTHLAARVSTILARIDAARERAGRTAPVRLVAVSKTQTPEAIREAYACGVRDFGENYAQELRDKREQLADLDVRWHFIGPLQSNKAKWVADVALLHTVDRPSILSALEARVATTHHRLEVLVQVNVGQEPQKAGCREEDLPILLDHFKTTPHVVCRGLMTIPPAGDPESARVHFRRLACLRAQWGAETREGVELRELSMGMSDDFEVAVEEGATLVRVGTAVFGARGSSPMGTAEGGDRIPPC